MLSQILAHEFVWNEELKCYTSSEKSAQVEVDDDVGEGGDAPVDTAVPTER